VLANIAFIIVVIFFERKDPSATLAWVMALTFVPIVGFVLYLFLGQNYRRERMFRAKQEDDQRLRSIIDLQQKALRDPGASADSGIPMSLRHLVLLHLRNDGAVLTLNNRVTVFTDGTEKFASLLDDVRNAVDFVHLEYYIWKDDGIGNELREALTERARAGVEVRVLIDGLGGAGLPPRFFDGLREAGGEVVFFFPSFLRYLQLRYNYRNHRKIAIIDGKIGYIGSFNVGDDYLGLARSGGTGGTRPSGSRETPCPRRISGSSSTGITPLPTRRWHTASGTSRSGRPGRGRRSRSSRVARTPHSTRSRSRTSS
jgi:cardiolipin synthase